MTDYMKWYDSYEAKTTAIYVMLWSVVLYMGARARSEREWDYVYCLASATKRREVYMTTNSPIQVLLIESHNSNTLKFISGYANCDVFFLQLNGFDYFLSENYFQVKYCKTVRQFYVDQSQLQDISFE